MISTQLSTITESVQLSPPQASTSPIYPAVSDSPPLDATVPCPGASLYTTLPQNGLVVKYEQQSPTSIGAPSDVPTAVKYEYATIISPPQPQHLRTVGFSQSSSPSSSPSTFNNAHSCLGAVTNPTSQQNQLYKQHQGHRSELSHHQYSAQEPHFNFPAGRETFYKNEAADTTSFDSRHYTHSDSAQYHTHGEFVSGFQEPEPFNFVAGINNNSNNNNSPCFTEPSSVCDYSFDTSSARFTGCRVTPYSDRNRDKLPPVSALLTCKSRVLELNTMMKTQKSVYDDSDDSGVSSLEEESQYTNLTNVPQTSHDNVHCYSYDAHESNFEEWSILKNEPNNPFDLDNIFNIEQNILCDDFCMDCSTPESDEYDSGSTDAVPLQCFTFTNTDGLYRPVNDGQSIRPYSKHESLLSSDSEEPVLEEMLPHFSEIQNHAESEKVSHYVRSTSLNPKKKRKIVRESPSYVEKERRKPGRKPGQVSNVLHLWEFMRDLLHSSENQGIIEWISKPEGVFKVINSTEVARLWGEKKKNKKKMTYEKLSRSLRYSRLEGYFADLPKDKSYPKKLCFKFGPKSKDWH